MSETYQHICKVEDGGCGRTYSSLEIDGYFCKDCIQSRKALYAEIDKKIVIRKPTKSSYELYMEKCKTVSRTLPDGTTVISSTMRA